MQILIGFYKFRMMRILHLETDYKYQNPNHIIFSACLSYYLDW